jgi:serine protease Do
MRFQGLDLNAEAQRNAEKRRGKELSASLCESLRLCVMSGLTSVTAWPRCVFTFRLPLTLVLFLLAQLAGAQDSSQSATLRRDRYRNGEGTLRAFAPISEATRYSIVKFNVDGATVALGTVVDTNGLALTKASELKKGKLTCWLAIDKEVDAEVIATDEEEDVALVRVRAPGLKPIRWAEGDVAVGQWAITPGIAETPHAVGIISALPRRIRPPRALIGVQFEFNGSATKIQELIPGLGAEKAGLKPGDLIVGINHVTVTNRVQVVEALREFREGQTVKLRVRREEKEFDADVRMMVLQAGESSAETAPQQRRDRLAGEVSKRAEGFEQAIEHDSVLHPWLCGGPLVNLDGKAIGLNIARAGRVTTYALPTRLVKRILDNLKPKPIPAAR